MTPGKPLSAFTIIAGASIFGAVAGIGSLATTVTGRTEIADGAKGIGIRAGLSRAREPRPGDYWAGCNDARAAGTAPIYEGEPGYREDMDGDGDGIACETPR